MIPGKVLAPANIGGVVDTKELEAIRLKYLRKKGPVQDLMLIL